MKVPVYGPWAPFQKTLYPYPPKMTRRSLRPAKRVKRPPSTLEHWASPPHWYWYPQSWARNTVPQPTQSWYQVPNSPTIAPRGTPACPKTRTPSTCPTYHPSKVQPLPPRYRWAPIGTKRPTKQVARIGKGPVKPPRNPYRKQCYQDSPRK